MPKGSGRNKFSHFTPRDIPSQNIVNRLFMREIHGPSSQSKARTHRGRLVNTARGFYMNIYPNYTLVNVEKPPCFLRKFTPCGKYFIAFSMCQTSLEIYRFHGAEAAGDLIQECTDYPMGSKNYNLDFLTNDFWPGHNKLRNNVFDKFFTLEHTVHLAEGGEQLNRECSLFSECGRFVIVGSACYLPDEPHPPMHEIYRNNESVAPNPRNPLEDYTIHCVDIEVGVHCDSLKFKNDKIFLSHNQGIYLYKDVLAILSVQHQTIYIYQLDTDLGGFCPVVRIGRTLFDNDELLLSSTGQSEGQQVTNLPTRVFGNHPASQFTYRNHRENVINQLKHRILVYLYKRACKLAAVDENPYEVRRFYQYFDQLRALRMWKMQLLDENHLLIKYASEEVVTLRSSEPNSQASFFVVYNFKSTEVVAVYENTSEDLLNMFENYCDFFRNTNVHDDKLRSYQRGWNGKSRSMLVAHHQVTSSPCNNIHAALIQQRFKQTIVSAKNGGTTEARKRVLAQLPISAQSYTVSPYLDLNLFSYDEKWVSVMERPKACGEHPIQFYGRECGLLKFRIYAGLQGRQPPPPSARRLVAFIFHPTDPFAISVQRTNLEYVVNFHVRRSIVD